MPWLVWLGGLSASLQNKGLPVRFPVRAHAWVVGHIPSGGHVRVNHTLIFLSLSYSFPSSLSKNKVKSLKNIYKNKRRRYHSCLHGIQMLTRIKIVRVSICYAPAVCQALETQMRTRPHGACTPVGGYRQQENK